MAEESLESAMPWCLSRRVTRFSSPLSCHSAKALLSMQGHDRQDASNVTGLILHDLQL